MPVSTPNGYLDFTNATPRATKVIATSNVGIGTSNPEYGLDIHGTANVGTTTVTNIRVTDTTASTSKTSGSVRIDGGVGISGNVFAELPLATYGSNLVTYDKTTGQLFDSAGLFSNKLSVVSEQPPSSLTAATTTIADHGRYIVAASTSTNAQNIFAKTSGSSWSGAAAAYNTDGTYAGSTLLATGLTNGEWATLSLPYKTTLRHYVIEQASGQADSTFPRQIKLYGSNDEGTSWTLVHTATSLSGSSSRVIVDATTKYKKYGFVFVETNNSTQLYVGEIRLFAESFAIDGGKIEMATSAVTGGETVMDQTTGHTREPAVLKKYPELKMGGLDNQTKAGVTVSSSSSAFNNYGFYNSNVYNQIINDEGWHTGAVPSSVSGSAYTIGGVTGEWHKTEFPNKLKVQSFHIAARSGFETTQAPKDLSILGSNDDSTWVLLKSVTGSSYIAGKYTPIQIDATDYYKYLAVVVTDTVDGTTVHGGVCTIGEMYWMAREYVGEGDTSLDTTITSKYNTPDLTNASLYLDGLKGSTATDYSGNDLTVTENTVFWDSTEKAWELTGAATSNIVTGDLGFVGDQPHSISAWVKADQLNGDGLFHLGTAEGEGDAASRVGFVDDSHISWGGENHYFSNAEWHNVTYTYNGEGSDKKLYLDGRLVGSAKNEDTFGDYPPFAMTTYSEYGYTVSENHPRSGYNNPYALFDNDTGDDDSSPYEWWSTGDVFSSDGQTYTGGDSIGGHSGAYVKLELPHKLKLAYVAMWPRDYNNNTTPNPQTPKDFKFIASNDNVNWDLLYTETGFTDIGNVEHDFVINSQTGYKYYAMVISKVRAATLASICELKLYGHRENDIVRFPDPTNVLKYPHVAMTGPAQRGYVVTSASNTHTGGTTIEYNGTNPHRITDDDIGSSYFGLYDSGTTSPYVTSTGYWDTANYPNLKLSSASGTPAGDWVAIEMPRKLTLERIEIAPRGGILSWSIGESVRDFEIWATNDNSSWTRIHQTVDATAPTTVGEIRSFDINASVAYKRFALIVTRNGSTYSGATGRPVITLGRWHLYGTEPEDVIARIGDGYDGKVRNLRVFSTALSQDRVQEIFDADKDEFGLAKSSVSVYRGHLGIGTTEPKAALTVMDEVAELEEFPPRAMTANETYMEGHGVFKASASYAEPSNLAYPWKAFSKDTEAQLTGWLGTNDYNAVTGSNPGEYGGANQLTGSIPMGEWLKIELPHKIKLNKYALKPLGIANRYGVADYPKTFYIYGSNDGSSWELIDSRVNTSKTPQILGAAVASNETITYSISNNGLAYYDKYAIVITKINSEAVYAVDNTVAATYLAIGEWRLFGTRQGQSTLHDGELKLTKNLTVPRIGPPLDADDTPRRDRLVVEYNTSTNPTENGTVKDTSGRGLDGLFYGGASYDATEKTLDFDGTGDYMRSGILSNMSGDKAVSYSLWIKANELKNTMIVALSKVGVYETSKTGGVFMESDGTLYNTVYGNGIQVTGAITTGTWIHIVATKIPGGSGTTTQTLYVNGVKPTQSNWNSGTSLSLDEPVITLGASPTLNQYFNGSISNFKLYDVALTADEVKRLYDMGRCDEGRHVVNFSKTRVGIGLGDGEAPRADLDVRGGARFDTCYGQSSLITSKFHSLADNSTTARYVVRHATKNNATSLSLVIHLDGTQRGGFLRVYGTGGYVAAGGGLKFPQYALIFFSWDGATTLHTEVAEEFETDAASSISTSVDSDGYLTITRTNSGNTSYMSLYVEAFYEGGIYIE